MKTINIFLTEEDSVINIMPAGFDPGIIEGIVRDVLNQVLDEESEIGLNDETDDQTVEADAPVAP